MSKPARDGTGQEDEGRWPSWQAKLKADFLPAPKEPTDAGIAGIVTPPYKELNWTRGSAAISDEALATAKLAREHAEARIASAEGRGTRLTQTGLTLLASVLAITGFEASRLRSAHVALAWWLLLLPSVAAIGSLALVIVQAIGIDGVAAVGGFSPSDVAQNERAEERRREQLRQEVYAAEVADWTAKNKLDEVLKARAWLTRAILTQVMAAVVAAAIWAWAVAPAAPTSRPVPGASPSPTAGAGRSP